VIHALADPEDYEHKKPRSTGLRRAGCEQIRSRASPGSFLFPHPLPACLHSASDKRTTLEPRGPPHRDASARESPPTNLVPTIPIQPWRRRRRPRQRTGSPVNLPDACGLHAQRRWASIPHGQRASMRNYLSSSVRPTRTAKRETPTPFSAIRPSRRPLFQMNGYVERLVISAPIPRPLLFIRCPEELLEGIGPRRAQLKQ